MSLWYLELTRLENWHLFLSTPHHRVLEIVVLFPVEITMLYEKPALLDSCFVNQHTSLTYPEYAVPADKQTTHLRSYGTYFEASCLSVSFPRVA